MSSESYEKMIEVHVGNEHGGERPETCAGSRPGSTNPRRELADGPCEHRIGEYEDVVDLYENRRMTESTARRAAHRGGVDR